VRIHDDVRKAVVFFGFEDPTPGKGGINCIGTGFLIAYDGSGYLVTAKHLAHDLGDNPFVVRINTKDGGSENLDADGVRWYGHPDPNVDVAVIPLSITAAYDANYIPEQMLAVDELVYHEEINTVGVGDLTYTVGLFRLMSGEKRNLPIVHFGSVAMMPRDEKIPVKDWRDRSKTIKVEGYLVETQAISGLSGSPVFVRPTTAVNTLPPNMLVDPRFSNPLDHIAAVPTHKLFLLGLWSGSWDAPPDEVLAAQTGASVRVPVGIGIVVSAQKIKETLDHEDLIAMRKDRKERLAAQEAEAAATPDSAIPPARSGASAPASDVNPNGREDFNSLLGAAVKKPAQAG
jgi:hypothetical protein